MRFWQHGKPKYMDMGVQVGDGFLYTPLSADDGCIRSRRFELCDEKTHGRLSEMETVINISKTGCMAVVENYEDMVAGSERMKIFKRFKCCGMIFLATLGSVEDINNEIKETKQSC
jgi:hypothetical protein